LGSICIQIGIGRFIERPRATFFPLASEIDVKAIVHHVHKNETVPVAHFGWLVQGQGPLQPDSVHFRQLAKKLLDSM
jgi:hypothetical protein